MSLKKGSANWSPGLVLFIVLLSSCASLRKSNTLFQSEYDKFADTAKTVYVANAAATPKDNTYRIKPFDLIGVRNIQNLTGLTSTSSMDGVEATSVFRTDNDGNIRLPVVGTVNVNGLTRQEAAKKIEGLYEQKLLKNPLIEVTIINLKVTLLGEVTRPGHFQLEKEDTNFIDLLGKSGNLLPSSDPSKIKIIRGDLKNPEIIYLNLKDIRTLSSDKLKLQNNDIIYVPARGVYSAAEGVRNYSILLQPVILLLNAAVIIYSLSR